LRSYIREAGRQGGREAGRQGGREAGKGTHPGDEVYSVKWQWNFLSRGEVQVNRALIYTNTLTCSEDEVALHHFRERSCMAGEVCRYH